MYNQLYLDSQRRVLDLVTPLSGAELTRGTPACPLPVFPARDTDLIEFG